MLSIMAAFSFTVSRRMTEVADLLGVIGAAFLVLGGLPFLSRKLGMILGGLFLAAAFLLLGIAVHWGVNPYLRVK